MSNTANDSVLNAEHQFSLGLINDAFHMGMHCWWLLGLILSFGLFTMILSYVAGLLDNVFSSKSAAILPAKTYKRLEGLYYEDTADKMLNYPLYQFGKRR